MRWQNGDCEMYKIILKDNNTGETRSKEMGSWRDRAAEVYGSIRRRAASHITVTLFDTYNHVVVYSERGEK